MARFLRRRRRTLAAALLCGAVAISVYQLTPASAPQSPVVVAAADLPAGAPVSASQLRIARIPAGAVPDGALREVAAAEGKRLSAPVRRGGVLTDASTVGPGLLAGTPPGTAAVPVRVADPDSLQLVRTGQTVDLVLAEESGREGRNSSRLAAGVTVLWTGSGAEQSGTLLGAPKDQNGLLVVAASPEVTPLLAGASARGKVFFALVEAHR
ncbi:RcpC/CpaB family pilus assembly protein [Sinomonas terrae]|uniref:RcpC/CpaB family pilus assembly protein n=1 Tax=Sinomonas terrae TaxID=2908838 RepID=A0ABS9TYL8_9MICC|nr:RcpC/CpaB family pilus assembly protein [Sinomonas terrae]MCH6469440.1 RcpC/CpaB family pilus assembly protein [Sinomonas terrae]